MNRIEPPRKLKLSILSSIVEEERHRAKRLLMIFAPASLLSLISIIFSIQYVLKAFYQSGFYTYFSLLLSDPDVVLTYWKEFAMSLVDTIPFMWITVSLISIALFLICLRMFSNSIRNNFSPSFSN